MLSSSRYRTLFAAALASLFAFSTASPQVHSSANVVEDASLGSNSILDKLSPKTVAEILSSARNASAREEAIYLATQNVKRDATYHNPAKEPWRPKGVFAHFMVSNVLSWSASDWVKDIRLARDARIDAFALNMAYDEGSESQLDNAFAAASQVPDFYLFFSFDYAGNGAWPKDVVRNLINKYKQHPRYYKYQGKAFASTFEGPDASQDWVSIKAETNCFFIPDWSSLGANDALHKSNGVADGLFSWAAWPWGKQDSDTYTDASYLFYLDHKKPYMMPVSPWFFTNMPGFKKNWAWKGDDLWRDRWEQILAVKPDFVQIITWNDYGESHYIGPLHSESMGAFSSAHGKSPSNYALDHPHDGWRALLPFYIEAYKTGKTTVSDQRLVTWYRPTPYCQGGATTGNTATQLQVEFSPAELMRKRIFFSALLISSHSTVTVTIGGKQVPAEFHHKPAGEVGVYHGNADMNGMQGVVEVKVTNAYGSMKVQGKAITSACSKEANWNAWVGAGYGPRVDPKPYSILQLDCVEGTGGGEFKELCGFTCARGYCPVTACVCSKLGPKKKWPTTVKGDFYPADKKSSLFTGLCGFACQRGKCPAALCSSKPGHRVEPTVSPFTPSACTAGTSDSNPDLAELCEFTCKYGFCPRNSCKCTQQGTLLLFPKTFNNRVVGRARSGKSDDGLCDWACKRGTCPLSCSQGLRNSRNEVVWDVEQKQSGPCHLDEKTEDIAKLDKNNLRTLSTSCRTQQLLTTIDKMAEMAILDWRVAYAHSGGSNIESWDQAFNNFLEVTALQVNAVMQGPWFKNDSLHKFFICRLDEDYDKLGKKGKNVRCPGTYVYDEPPNLTVVLRNEKEAEFWDDLQKNYGITKQLLFSGGGYFNYDFYNQPDSPMDNQNWATWGTANQKRDTASTQEVAGRRTPSHILNFPDANTKFMSNPGATFRYPYMMNLKSLRTSFADAKKRVAASKKNSIDDALDLVLASQSAVFYAYDVGNIMASIRHTGAAYGRKKAAEQAKEAGLIIINVVVPIIGGAVLAGGGILSSIVGGLMITAPIDYAGGMAIKEKGSAESIAQLIEAIIFSLGVGGFGRTSEVASIATAGSITVRQLADRFAEVPVSALARTGPKNIERTKYTDFVADVCRRR